MAKHPSEIHDLSIALKPHIIKPVMKDKSVIVKAKQLRSNEIEQSERAATKVSISIDQ